MKKELVSIIIPTFKRPGMLKRAIDSCLNQSYKNIEIIIVDDNDPSSEGRMETEKFMEQYANNSTIRYIKRDKNGGGCESRNTGIKEAKGTFIAFLDDDDLYLENKISKQVEFMIKNNLDASFTGSETYDETQNKVVKIQNHKNINKYASLFIYHIVEMIVSPQTFMYKKEVLDELKGFDNVSAGQEYYLMYKTLINDYKVGCLPEILSRICIHKGERITTSKNKLKAEKDLYLLKKKHFNILKYSEIRQVKYIYKYNIWRKYYNSHSKKHIIYLLYIIISHPILLLKRKVLS